MSDTEREEKPEGETRDRCPNCGSPEPEERDEDLFCDNCGIGVCPACGSIVDGMILCGPCKDDLFFIIALAGFI